MANARKSQKKFHTIRFFPLFVLAMLVNILAQATHETGHHMVYQVTGHDPVWAFTKLVQLSETTPTNPGEWVEKLNPDGTTSWLKLSFPVTSRKENAIASAAGPLAGLLGAIFGLVMFRRSQKTTSKQMWLALSLTTSLAAVLYYMRSPIRTGGDEYDVAVQLGIAKSFIETPLALAFLVCLILAVRELPSWRTRLTWLGTILLGSITTGLTMVMLDPIVIAQVDAGNPWAHPIIGYSLPVFVVILLTCFGVWAWFHWQSDPVEN